jgi:DNA-binding NarL/FixJ family response regulator
VLVTDTVRTLTRGVVPFRFVPRGSPVLKGLAEPVALYRVVTADDPLAQAPPTPAEAPRLRVVLADDAVLLRDAIAMALGAAGFEVVGQAGEVTGLLALVERTAPDVAIVDVRMPPTHTTEGLEAAREIRRLRPRIAILVLSQYVETRYALELIRDDAAGIGYLLKDRVSRVADLADAVRRVADGGSVIDPEVVGRLLGRQRTQSPIDELTPREREILGLMAEGRSNQGIADRLTLELKTVENHVGQICSKLALEPASDDHRRVLAVLTYLRAA